MKRCSKCGKAKPESDFYRRMAKCKQCHGEVARDWARRNPEKRAAIDARHAAKKRLGRIARTYDIDPVIYQAMEAAQQGVCLICLEFVGSLDTDHDHVTGAVRGLLCRNCNRGLGYFKDDPQRILRAVVYLLRSGNAIVA